MKSINPHNGQVMEEFPSLSNEEINEIIEKSYQSFKEFRKISLSDRKTLLKNLASVFEKNSQKYGEVVALEMGKPIEESVSEVKKAAKHALYCSENLENFLKEDSIKTEF